MTPIDFNQSNCTFGPPSDMEESQVRTIPAFRGTVERGSCEGAPVVIVAWLPTPAEREAISEGSPVFLTFLGGLPPHVVTTSFQQATNLA
jgi:hypothetical protein